MVQRQEHLITISTKTLMKIVLIGILLWFLWFMRDILLLLFLSIIFASLIDPFANSFARYKIPRGLAVLIVVAAFFGLLALLVGLLVPVITEEGRALGENFSVLWNQFVSRVDVVRDIAARFGVTDLSSGAETFKPALTKTVGGIFSTVTGLIQGVFSVILVIVLTFYLVVQEDAVKQFVLCLAPDHYRPYLNRLVSRIKRQLALWLRAQITLSFIVGLFVYLGLTALNVEYALLLALFAGVMEMIPYLGPVLAAVPPIFLSFAQHPDAPIYALAVLILFIVIQQIENHFLVPKVMQKAVGINPLVSIISIIVGVKLAGLVGALIAIPVATAVSVFIESLRVPDTHRSRAE